jgi:hypothetical protein
MLRIGFLLSLLLLVNGDDCDPQKQNQRISSLESEVKQLKDQVAELEQKQAAAPEHHYELRSEGSRTFRFDPATGDTCIQLASDADWKRKETKEHSCDCTDAFQHWEGMAGRTDQEQQNYYNHVVKSACGT